MRRLVFFCLCLCLFLGLTRLAALSGRRIETRSWIVDWLSRWRAPPVGASVASVVLAHQPSFSPPVSGTVVMQDAQLLREMFRVVLLRDPASPREFNYFMGPIAQGGSLEGAYNGIVSSPLYHHLEESSGPASPQALQVFSRELVRMEKNLRHPTDFDIDPPLDAANVSERFRQASLFYLKRVLGNEALKVIEAKERLDKAGSSGGAAGSKRDPEGGMHLATWYGHWAARLAREHVDFGIPLRNIADSDFHRRWAASATEDRLSWEVLNRVHRLLDAAEGRADSAPAQGRTVVFPGRSG